MRVIVPVGNGALIIGVARGIGRVLGVVAKEAPVMALSVEAGHPVDCDRCATFADGMAVRVAIPLAVEELRRRHADDDGLGARNRARGRRLRGGGHPRGGIGGRAAGRVPRAAVRAEPTVLIVTGRNIDDELHRRAVEEPDSFPD